MTAGEYQAGVNQFQAAVRKRESMRLKLQMNSAPGVLEKELMTKINVEESVCQVRAIGNPEYVLFIHNLNYAGYRQIPECMQK